MNYIGSKLSLLEFLLYILVNIIHCMYKISHKIYYAKYLALIQVSTFSNKKMSSHWTLQREVWELLAILLYIIFINNSFIKS